MNNIQNKLRFLIFFIMAFTILTTLSGASADHPRWVVISEEEGIKVSRRDLPETRLAEFRVEGIIKASCAKIMALFSDLTYYPQWVIRCIKAELLEQNFSENTYDMPFNEYYQIVYAETDFPWPFQNRDYILKGSMSYVPPQYGRSEYYVLETHAVRHQKKPQQQGKVRMTTMNMVLKLTPMGESRRETEVDMTIHGDPGGFFPTWLANALSKDIFHNTFKRMRDLVLKGTYNRKYERLIRHHINVHVRNRK